jgi:hypothetical protein
MLFVLDLDNLDNLNIPNKGNTYCTYSLRGVQQ